MIFQDNDFEIFVDPDASNHFYKEFEINAKAATWDLCVAPCFLVPLFRSDNQDRTCLDCT